MTDREEWLRKQNEMLMAIAIQAKKLLLSDEIKDEHNYPETEKLCEVIERYEAEYSEISPQLKPLGKKAWYARLDEKGQVASLPEILVLSGEQLEA